MILFCILYAYPHVPSRILDQDTKTTWFSIGSMDALRAAISNLIQTSPVIQAALAPGQSVVDVTHESMCNPSILDQQLNLRLYREGVSIICRQLFHAIAAVFTAIDSVPDIATREFLMAIYRDHQLIQPSFKLPSDRSDRTGLLRFCSEQTVEFMQPYFASDPVFFYPFGLTSACTVR